jgi:hypothetical protein
MLKSSSDKKSAAVPGEDILDLEFVFLKPVTCLSPESADYWIRFVGSFVLLGDLSQLDPSTKNSLPDDGSKDRFDPKKSCSVPRFPGLNQFKLCRCI